MSKKYFNLPDSSLSRKSKIFLGIVIFVVVGINILVFTNGYYQAYHPDYEYNKISKQVDFHIYQPTYLPKGVEQSSKFYIVKDFIGNSDAVRTAYDTPIELMAKGTASVATVINQSQVDPSFNIQTYTLSKNIGKTTPTFKRILLSNFPGQQAYLQTGGIAKFIYLYTPDNVLVSIGSLKETEENLQNIANSLK